MRKIKYTEDMLKELCVNANLIFEKIESEKINNKRRRYIYYKCPKHLSRGIQRIAVEKFVSNKQKCQYCNHSKLKDTFEEEMSVINPDIEICSNYVNWDTKIQCRCKKMWI